MSKQASQRYRKEKDRKSNDKIDNSSTTGYTGGVSDQSGTKQGASNDATTSSDTTSDRVDNSYITENYDRLLK